MKKCITAFFEANADVRAIAILRILVGPIVIVHLYPFWASVAVHDQYFADGFFVPFFVWWPVLPQGVYVALLGLGFVSALTLSLGLLTRVSAALTFAIVSFNVLSNQIFFHHNRSFLMAILFGLALTHSGRALSLDALWERRRSRPLAQTTPHWRLVLFRVLACTPYVASGFSKLIDADWWSGTVMRLRIERYRHIAEGKGVPEWLIDPIASEGFNAVMWKFVVLTELFVGVGYWFKRTRTAAMFMALGFHVLIEITSRVSVFSYLGICATLLWVVPRTRDRVLWLDWIARFDVRTRSEGPAIELLDRDGTKRTGASAFVYTCSRLPLLMPLYVPRLLLPIRSAEPRKRSAS